MKKIALVVALFSFTAMLAGCKDKGQDFIGHWEGQASAQRTSLDISYSDGIYHVDYNSPDPVFGTKLETEKREAVAVSDTVLVIHAQLGDVTIRREGDTVTVDDHKFLRKN